MELRHVVEAVDDRVDDNRRGDDGERPAIANREAADDEQRREHEQEPRGEEERARPGVVRVLERPRPRGGGGRAVEHPDVALWPVCEDERQRDEPAERVRHRLAQPVPLGDEEREHQPDEAVRQLHERRVANGKPGARVPETIARGTQNERNAHDDEGGRERLGVEVEPNIDVPLAVLPRRVAGELTAHERPDGEDPGGEQPDRAAAGRVEPDVGGGDDRAAARATSVSVRPITNATSGLGSRPTARIGIIGIDHRSGHPNTAAPGGCIL